MNFEIGKKYGIIGDSSSDKTTIFKLLSDMFDDFQGNINYDSENITNINKEVLYDNVAYIDQNIYIFNESIRENICLGKNFSDETVSKLDKVYRM